MGVGTLNGVPIARISSTSEGKQYYITDNLGVPVAMTNGSKTATWKGQYYPFGLMRYQMVSVTNNLRYPGQWADDEVNLYYNWHRHYHPSWGRYWEADPLGIHGREINPYLYGLDNPNSNMDPTGLSSRNSFWGKWWNNVKLTNKGSSKFLNLATEIPIPGLNVGLTDYLAAQTDAVTLTRWVKAGFSGLRMGRSVFTAAETGITAVTVSGIGFVIENLITGGAIFVTYEVGVGIGSIGAVFLPDDCSGSPLTRQKPNPLPSLNRLRPWTEPMR